MLLFCKGTEIQGGVALVAGGRFNSSYDQVAAAVTGKFNRYLRRTLDPQTGVVVQFGKYGERCQTKFLGYRFIDPASFVLKNDRDFNFADADPITGYQLDPETGRLQVNSAYVTAENSYQATFNCGIPALGSDPTIFDTAILPPELHMAAIKQGIFEMSKLTGQTTGDQQTVTRGNGRSQAVTRVKLVDGLLPDVASDLNPYRKPLNNV